MTPAEKALWFIESHFADDISLEEIATIAGVSRHHLVRAFGAATGRSVMRYVRGRRLTEAARALANGASDILVVALDAGYGSHEAFTRAFRDQFGTTPEAVRASRSLDSLALVEPVRLPQSPYAILKPPRFEIAEPLLIAGLGERYTDETSAGIAAQWQRFHPYMGHIPGQIDGAAYGVGYNSDDEGNREYITGVQVTGFSDLPDEFSRLRVPARRYAVFAHEDHVATIRRTWATIWNKWLPVSGHDVADAPDFEHYDEAFDPRTGTGGLEIWIPLNN
ncbi:MAG TPA: AraC family transcriptional regulator [Thermomicrobiales bacterium]|nr:AraC family transcriptional regulator [Thermomicrobiales bacterium]